MATLESSATGSRRWSTAVGNTWPYGVLTTLQNGRQSVVELGYFFNLAEYSKRNDGQPPEKGDKPDKLAWQELPDAPPFRRLFVFSWDHSSDWNPGYCMDRLVVSERLGVRGLVIGEAFATSSSGLNNSREIVRLFHHGRLTPEQMKAMEGAPDALAEEVALWKTLAAEEPEGVFAP